MPLESGTIVDSRLKCVLFAEQERVSTIELGGRFGNSREIGYL